MTRETLPSRRVAETTDFDCRGIGYTASLGLFQDQRPAELFLNANKQSTDVDHDARDTAILISFALQHGATVATLAQAMTRDAFGAPQGLAGHALDAIGDMLREGGR
jgi:ribonucleoside-diphosphate reductase alpha chain